MNKKRLILVGTSILFLGIGILFSVMRVGTPAEEKRDFNILPEAEKRFSAYDYLTTYAASMLEHIYWISKCEINVNFADDELIEISQIVVKLDMTLDDAETKTLTPDRKDDILKYISMVFDVPAESIVLFIA